MRVKPWASWVLSLEAHSGTWQTGSFAVMEKDYRRLDTRARFTACCQRLECDSPQLFPLKKKEGLKEKLAAADRYLWLKAA